MQKPSFLLKRRMSGFDFLNSKKTQDICVLELLGAGLAFLAVFSVSIHHLIFSAAWELRSFPFCLKISWRDGTAQTCACICCTSEKVAVCWTFFSEQLSFMCTRTEIISTDIFLLSCPLKLMCYAVEYYISLSFPFSRKLSRCIPSRYTALHFPLLLPWSVPLEDFLPVDLKEPSKSR